MKMNSAVWLSLEESAGITEHSVTILHCKILHTTKTNTQNNEKPPKWYLAIILNKSCNSLIGAHLDLVPHLAVFCQHSCGVERRLGNHHGLLKETSQCWIQKTSI